MICFVYSSYRYLISLPGYVRCKVRCTGCVRGSVEALAILSGGDPYKLRLILTGLSQVM